MRVRVRYIAPGKAWTTIACLFMVAGQAAASETTREALPIQPVTERPCLLMSPVDRADIRTRRDALAKPWPRETWLTRVLEAYLTGDETLQKAATEEFVSRFRKVFADERIANLQRMRRTNELSYAYDVVASFGYLTEAEKGEFKETVVAFAKKCVGGDPARFPSKEHPNPWGREWKKGYSTNNRWTDQFLVAGLAGLNFPEHPLAEPWVRYAIEQTHHQLDHGILEGAWNETTRYHNWTLLLYATWFQALKRRTGVDFFQHPKTKQLLDWYVRFSSPLVRLPGTTKRTPAGEPTLPAWGDANYGPLFEACGMLAPQYVETDPAFSKRLMWIWRRAGSPIRGGQHLDLGFPVMVDPRLPDEPQVLGSAFCRTLGYVLFRSGFNTPQETVVMMRGGQKGRWHQRSDLGSFDLFSHGVPLVLGSQSGDYGSKKTIEWNRSQKSNNTVVFGGTSRSRFDSGTMLTWRSTPQADYAAADLSKDGEFSWRRHLLLMKNPDYVVIWDELDSEQAAEFYLHTTAEKLIWHDHRVVSQTAYDATLDVHVLLPPEKLKPNEKEGRFGQWIAKSGKIEEDLSKKRDPYPFYFLKYFTLPAEPGEDFLTVLHPKKPEAKPLAVTLISSSDTGVRLRVTAEAQAQEIAISRKRGATITQEGRPALVLQKGVAGDAEPGVRFMAGDKETIDAPTGGN